MTELNFRVTVVPRQPLNSTEKNELISQIKSTIESCRLTSVSQYSPVKKAENEDYSEIEELTLEISGKSETVPHVSKAQLYEDFYLKWRGYFCCLPPSYVEFYSNDSFVNCKRPCHKLTCQNITFGVLPHNGSFYRFAELQTNEMIDTVHFFHDTRNIVIYWFNYEITFSYQNIRNIFINIDNKPSKMYFDLFNPPIVFKKEQISRGRTKRCRAFLPGIDPDVLGRANVLCLVFGDPQKVREVIARIHNRCSEKSVYYSCISDVVKNKPLDRIVQSMDFDSTYLITALLKRNFTLISQTSHIDSSLGRLKDLSLQNPDFLEKALTSVLFALDSGKILNFWHTIERQYIYYAENKDEINFKDYIVPSKCTMIRRIILTPTRQLLWPKEIMMGNRVLRNFDAEYSVRVSFREDNLSKLSFNALNAHEEIMKSCIKNPMTDGIHIGSRNYEFLAWSNSQIRDHGVWMYAQDKKGQTSAMIREWMGNFSHIHNVPKYMARMGQCFSQTEDTLSIPLDPNLVRIEDDIERYDNINGETYCFSDGIGRMSVDLASQVHKALGHDKLCSAFQVRYGGCKGMLVIDPSLTDAQIVFRKSMKKFECPNSTRLEIARTSSPIPLNLNRPFITLLNDLGVRHRTFLRLQESMLKTLTEMLYEESVAAGFLLSNTSTDLYNFKELTNSGIHLTTEPFFKSLLLALHRHRIEKIKLRANIAVDPSKGRNMLGVLDETRTLNYGEVFVQYSRDIFPGETTEDTIIYKGEVLVTKNPCMYPGDVRKFKAVDVLSLHHIVDCIVFPQKGPRPHPNEMAGSDLDGDEYVVIWDPDLIFHRSNYEAGNFPAPKCSEVSNITVSHMIGFLQDYIKNDQLGIIANAHLAQADNGGIFSPICHRLAEQFFIAVDFAKTGNSGELDFRKRPKVYPDFMENVNQRMYKSKKALGKMHRVCKDFEAENEMTSIGYENIQVDPDLVYDGWERFKDDALKARNKYNALFKSVIRNYGIQHEAEALSGAFTNLHTRFHERKDRDEIEKVIISCIKKLNKCMMEEFMGEFNMCGSVKAIENAMLQKASAWYIVTYSDPNAKFLSFPWAVSKYLINIKIRRTLAYLPPFSPAIMNLDKKILEYDSDNLLSPNKGANISNDYRILCDPLIIKQVLHTLILWAQEEEILKRGEFTQEQNMDVFVKLFFHVSEKLGYVTKLNNRAKYTKMQYCAGQLCLEFLKYCSTFRFYNKYEMADMLPFKLFNYDKITKCAIVSYHKFALTGTLQTLNLNEELIEMKNPMFVDADVLTPILKAEETLIRYSQVSELSLREIHEKKKVCVTAIGSKKALQKLKYILRKKNLLQNLLMHNIISVF